MYKIVHKCIFLLESHPESVFFGRYRSVFLGNYDTDTEGKIGQYFRYRGYEKVRIYSKMYPNLAYVLPLCVCVFVCLFPLFWAEYIVPPTLWSSTRPPPPPPPKKRLSTTQETNASAGSVAACARAGCWRAKFWRACQLVTAKKNTPGKKAFFLLSVWARNHTETHISSQRRQDSIAQCV